VVLYNYQTPCTVTDPYTFHRIFLSQAEMAVDGTNNFQVWTLENGSSRLLFRMERGLDEHQARGTEKHKQKIPPRRRRRIWENIIETPREMHCDVSWRDLAQSKRKFVNGVVTNMKCFLEKLIYRSRKIQYNVSNQLIG
jgi:hypothetical protein